MHKDDGSNAISRREFMGRGLTSPVMLAAGAALFGLNASAAMRLPARDRRNPPHIEPDVHFDLLIGRVKFDCDRRVVAMWNTYPGAERNLLTAFADTVHCRTKIPKKCNDGFPCYGEDWQFNGIVDLTDLDAARAYPILLMTAEGDYTLSGLQQDVLKNYVEQGGFVIMDDCVYDGAGDFFYRSSIPVLQRAFGADVMGPVPADHEVFHNAYDFGDKGIPFVQGQHHPAQGVFLNGRMSVFLSSVDLHCGWADGGRHMFKPQRGYDPHAESIKMGVNLLLYGVSH